jgi:two-component system, response regulator YesN
MKILIVEDEVNAREGLADLLEKLSSEYIVCGKATDGEQGVLLADEIKPDLIIADIEMPKLNGLEMIERIKKTGEEPLFLILSGYSDFKYAQTGIKLGVVEYLLKPITYSNLKKVMLEMSDRLNIKKTKAAAIEKDMPKEEILKEILYNRGKISEDAYKSMERAVKQREGMFLINFYLREKYRDKDQLFIKELIDFMDYYKIKTFFYSNIKEYNYITAFISTPIEFVEIIKMLKYNLLFSLKRNGLIGISGSIIKLNELGEVKNSLEKLKTLSCWAIVLENKEIIYFELIEKLKVNKCIYPREIEAEALQAIKNNDYTKLTDINKKLVLYLKRDIYDPLEIIEVCGNYVFSILKLVAFLKGYNNNFYNEFKNEVNLDHIKSCCTMEEVEEHLYNFTENIFKRGDDLGTMNSLPVSKTLNYIKENYVDRISLEEIATKMNITPGYLSHLFTKEIGKSFSDYLKEYRVDKAKKLLLNGKMKIYEIAEKVGYSDPKYFCKIFKEVTGILPKEYMKFN